MFNKINKKFFNNSQLKQILFELRSAEVDYAIPFNSSHLSTMALLVLGHEFLVEFLEFAQHFLEFIDLRQNCRAEMICSRSLTESTASDDANACKKKRGKMKSNSLHNEWGFNYLFPPTIGTHRMYRPLCHRLLLRKSLSVATEYSEMHTWRLVPDCMRIPQTNSMCAQ